MKLFRNIGIIAITIFSFVYTERISNLVLENNEIYKTIENNSNMYNVEYVDAYVSDNTIIPGLNGKTVNIKSSYYNMKDINTFNEYYLIYDTLYPDVSIENNKDLIINRGNSKKKSVSFIIEYDESLINYFVSNNIPSSVLVDIDTFDSTLELEQINNDYKNFKKLDAILNKYNVNTNICYANNNIIDICREYSKYLVKSEIVVNNSTFIDVKNNISSGDIYYVSKNINIDNLNILIKSILFKDLDIVSISSLISEELE